MKAKMSFYVLIVFLLCSLTVYANEDLVVLRPTIYGDQEGAERLDALIGQNFALNAFSHFYEKKDKGIFVHIIGDRFTNKMSMELYGVALSKLDEETREKGLIYKSATIFDQPCLVISAVDTAHLVKYYRSNKDLRENIKQIIMAKSKFPVQTDNLLWRTDIYESKVFKGLFKNPDYSNLELFLQEDRLTKQTEQVKMVAGIINDNKDILTLKEIYNLLRAIDNEHTAPEAIFEVSASKILSTPILGGCTTYATAFSTLCRAKGIPAVVVDSAKIEWIRNGCSLHNVWGHFFVEVYIEDTWYLVDSTAGKLYKNYNRNNWFLPDGYIAFTKSLSFIDPGTTEANHNLLQRVAFVNKMVDYKTPKYPVVNLYDTTIKNRLRKGYERLDLLLDDSDVYEIYADPNYIDFSNID